MRIARYARASGGAASYGVVEGDGEDAVVVRLEGSSSNATASATAR